MFCQWPNFSCARPIGQVAPAPENLKVQSLRPAATPGGRPLSSGSHAVLIFLGSADPEGFQEPAPSSGGYDNRAAVLYLLGLTKIETTLGERGSYRTGDMRPPFGPVEAQAAEMAAC